MKLICLRVVCEFRIGLLARLKLGPVSNKKAAAEIVTLVTSINLESGAWDYASLKAFIFFHGSAQSL